MTPQLVMPGLDADIHLSSQGKMDRRVKPGNDGLNSGDLRKAAQRFKMIKFANGLIRDADERADLTTAASSNNGRLCHIFRRMCRERVTIGYGDESAPAAKERPAGLCHKDSRRCATIVATSSACWSVSEFVNI